ncbi:hypothetical protein [Lactococcus phage PMBT68]|nr:hypothetical protein [Lactococcus phage P1411]
MYLFNISSYLLCSLLGVAHSRYLLLIKEGIIVE